MTTKIMMTGKIIFMSALFSTIFLVDLVSFIPVLIVILLILNSVEKDLINKERKPRVLSTGL